MRKFYGKTLAEIKIERKDIFIWFNEGLISGKEKYRLIRSYYRYL